MGASEADVIDEEKEQELLNLLAQTGPLDKEELEASVDFDENTIQEVVRELLYEGQLTASPDWKFEPVDDT